jgi:CheY-like chemotaxis protein
VLVRVVEDHPDIATLLEETLPRFGIEVAVTTDNFADLLDHPAWDDVDVAIVDYNLGELTGGEILTWLDQHRPEIRRILFSAVAGVGHELGAELAHATLRKGLVDVEQIVETIRG